ncbi:MAG TPA: hypothetical protein VFU59_04245 [Candidatus Eisenbacteria bacterium]|nr:hypothetical protein [Candidatus Eisenbacteria bacterium]
MRRLVVRSVRFALVSLLSFVAPLLAPSPAFAQSLWLPRDTDSAVLLEMLRPNVEHIDAGSLSAAYFLGGRIRLSDRIAFVGELPYVRHENSGGYYYFYAPGRQSSIGNPYIGIETRSATSPLFVEVGVRPPLTSESDFFALLTGQATDAARYEAFAYQTTSLQFAVNLRETTENRIAYRVRFGPALHFLDNGPDETELWALYSLDVGYVGRCVRVGTGFSGRALVTEDYSNVGARTITQADLHADFLRGPIRPGLAVRLPLGGAANSFPVVLGVTLAWVR